MIGSQMGGTKSIQPQNAKRGMLEFRGKGFHIIKKAEGSITFLNYKQAYNPKYLLSAIPTITSRSVLSYNNPLARIMEIKQ